MNTKTTQGGESNNFKMEDKRSPKPPMGQKAPKPARFCSQMRDNHYSGPPSKPDISWDYIPNGHEMSNFDDHDVSSDVGDEMCEGIDYMKVRGIQRNVCNVKLRDKHANDSKYGFRGGKNHSGMSLRKSRV